ncbi:hypothetical protein O181_013968 [Austropuccinia psidii MF-1]|uniref:Uncharacterized protein n=1 Tax=Austropuccinia psidii MF-1 TaxID=1389203 RepID=A0A9Q3C0B8_9BASI|nr:hypothetical protein [Austropuccinia psidii MF-1]
MVMVSGLHHAISNQVPQVHHPILKEDFSHSVWKSIVPTRGPFEDTNHLTLRFWSFHFNSIPPRGYWNSIFQGRSQDFFNHQIGFQGIKHSRTPWTTQLVHTGGIKATCMALAYLAQFIFHCGN